MMIKEALTEGLSGRGLCDRGQLVFIAGVPLAQRGTSEYVPDVTVFSHHIGSPIPLISLIFTR